MTRSQSAWHKFLFERFDRDRLRRVRLASPIAGRPEPPYVVLRSAPMQALAAVLVRATWKPFAPVFISGPVGAGKTRAALMLHGLDEQRGRCGPVVDITVDASDAPLDLTLHDSSDAATSSPLMSVADRARGGLLLLEDIGNLPHAGQDAVVHLIDRLQKEGEASTHPVLRLVVTSVETPAELLQRGRLSEPLYDRVASHAVQVPPLSSHREDIPLLASAFVDFFGRSHRKSRALTAGARTKLMTYSYPGNIRELRNIIERSIILSSTPEIAAADVALHAR